MIKTIRVHKIEESVSNPEIVEDVTLIEDDINRLIVACIANDQNVLSAPKIGINKKILVIDQICGQGKNQNVHDPMVLVNPEIIEESHTVNPPSNKIQLNSVTLRYICRQGIFVTQTFTSQKMVDKIVSELKNMGENVNEFINGT